MSNRILTGIKPTGGLHIGNLYGAILPAINMANTADEQSYMFIADIHALNSVKDPNKLKEMTYSIAAAFLAFGLDISKTIFYKQSDISEIFELTSLLMNYTSKGLMNRAHAYKAIIDKDGNDDNVNMGLFTYPILMASDILIMQADTIPIGQDQKQHIEIARDIANTFNNLYNCNTFKLPKESIKHTFSIIGLDGRKMSKSYGNTIELFSTKEETFKKVMKIPTDSIPINDPKDKECLLYKLMKIFNVDNSYTEKFLSGGIGYGDAKKQLAETINSYLKPYREKYNSIINDTKFLDKCLSEGAQKAKETAKDTLYNVKKMIGLIG